MKVYLDSSEENMVDELALDAEGILDRAGTAGFGLSQPRRPSGASSTRGGPTIPTASGATSPRSATRSFAHGPTTTTPPTPSPRLARRQTAKRYTTSQVGSGCCKMVIADQPVAVSRLRLVWRSLVIGLDFCVTN